MQRAELTAADLAIAKREATKVLADVTPMRATQVQSTRRAPQPVPQMSRAQRRKLERDLVRKHGRAGLARMADDAKKTHAREVSEAPPTAAANKPELRALPPSIFWRALMQCNVVLRWLWLRVFVAVLPSGRVAGVGIAVMHPQCWMVGHPARKPVFLWQYGLSNRRAAHTERAA